jgi:hypothetical protein
MNAGAVRAIRYRGVLLFSFGWSLLQAAVHRQPINMHPRHEKNSDADTERYDERNIITESLNYLTQIRTQCQALARWAPGWAPGRIKRA